MKYNSLIIGLSVLALQSCTDNLIYIEPGTEAILTGNTYKAAFTENSSISTFSPGSQILLNASGSLQINNKVLTYIDNQWKAENEFDWNDMVGKTNITALYPVYSDFAYTRENLYKNDSLEDILYVKDEYPAGTPVNLQFRHLFSLLTLHLSGKLQNDFQKIEVRCPAVISAIEPGSAQITFAHDEAHTTSITQVSSSGNYSFIIPPAENMILTIDIQTDGKKYTTQLQSKSFTGNKEYTYNLKTSEKTPGIVTAEDWIAFSRLINNNTLTEYKGKILADFGETINGITTYYLLNSIDFTGVNCTDLKQIGYTKTDSYFSDIFDGQEHTLSNMPLKPYQATTGVFGAISSTGTVKNLRVKFSNIQIEKKSNSTKSGLGILVGVNNGHLYNCSIEHCSILFKDTEQGTNIGGLAGSSSGTIINCSVQNTNITNTTKERTIYIGGIAGAGNGAILNSFSANNLLKTTGTSNYVGGICGYSSTSSTLTINNCYVHINDEYLTPKKQSANFIGNANNVKIGNSYCYKNGYSNIKTGAKNSASIQNYAEGFSTSSGIPCLYLLNQWIDETAPTLYPDYTFTRWTDGGESLPAVFVTESQSRH